VPQPFVRDLAALWRRLLPFNPQQQLEMGDVVVPVSIIDDWTPLVPPLVGPWSYDRMTTAAAVGEFSGFLVEPIGNGCRVWWGHNGTGTIIFCFLLRSRPSLDALGITFRDPTTSFEGERTIDTTVSRLRLASLPADPVECSSAAADVGGFLQGRQIGQSLGVWVPPGLCLAVVRITANAAADTVCVVYEQPRG
jgi:hypothetical protein